MEGRDHSDSRTRRPSCQGLVSRCQGLSPEKMKEIVNLGTE